LTITPDQLLPYESVSEPHLRDAGAALSAANAAAKDARKEYEAKRQELPQAEQADAQASADAIEAGKPEPKARTNTLKAEEAVKEAHHALRTREILAEKAYGAAVLAIAQHGKAWAAERAKLKHDLEKQWDRLVEEVEHLHAERETARRIARAAGDQFLAVAAVSFHHRQLGDLEIARGSMDTAHIFTADILAGLRGLGVQKQPEAKPTGLPITVEARGSA
jgi:hypothetical protein